MDLFNTIARAEEEAASILSNASRQARDMMFLRRGMRA